MDYIIEAKGIHKYFPGVHALDDVDFSLIRGEILGLVGENGAGKSTLNKILSGVEQYDEGTYLFNGQQVRFRSAKEAMDTGISVIHQELNLCETMSVAQNICLGYYPKKAGFLLNTKEMNATAKKALEEVGLSDIPVTRKVEFLSSAQKQLVEVARAVSHDSRLLIMDEPTSALAPKEIEILHNVMRRLKERGISIIYISHKLDEIFAVCDRVSVMRDGKMIDTLDIKQVSQDGLIERMVGRKIEEMFQYVPRKTGEIALEVEHLSNEHVDNVSFYVREGEIVCFSGLMGAGRTETMKAVYGFDRRKNGTVKICGRTVPANSTEKAKRMGLGYISEDRKLEGIFPFFTVSDNISVVNLENMCSVGMMINERMLKEKVAEGIEEFNVKTSGPKQIMGTLSGGNQQKVLLARWLLNQKIKVLIVDEPTRGIDVGAKSEIYSLLNELASKGLAVVVVSSEMQEIINVCDRVYVMKGGHISGELERKDVTQNKLMELAIL